MGFPVWFQPPHRKWERKNLKESLNSFSYFLGSWDSAGIHLAPAPCKPAKSF